MNYAHGGNLAIYGWDEGEIQIFDVFVFLMPIVGFRAYTDEQTLRALKAQLRLRERSATPYDGQGMQGGSHPWSSAHYS
ncbi:MAG: hypothetical protein RXO22_05045 [Thermocladium sp.]